MENTTATRPAEPTPAAFTPDPDRLADFASLDSVKEGDLVRVTFDGQRGAFLVPVFYSGPHLVRVMLRGRGLPFIEAKFRKDTGREDCRPHPHRAGARPATAEEMAWADNAGMALMGGMLPEPKGEALPTTSRGLRALHAAEEGASIPAGLAGDDLARHLIAEMGADVEGDGRLAEAYADLLLTADGDGAALSAAVAAVRDWVRAREAEMGDGTLTDADHDRYRPACRVLDFLSVTLGMRGELLAD